jgi:1,2-diacylglycerol 3-alpha-glucosyltransferase
MHESDGRDGPQSPDASPVESPADQPDAAPITGAASMDASPLDAAPPNAEPAASAPDPLDVPDATLGVPARNVGPLRVALFTDNYGPGHSGILYAVQFLEGELLAHGHECLVVAPACDGPNPHAAAPGRREYRLPAIHLPGVPAALASGRGFEKALDAFAADPPDVIHVHGLGPVGLLGVWAAQRCGVPLLVTWHTDFEAYADHYARLTPFLDAWVRLLKLNTYGFDRKVVREQLRDLKPFLRPRRGMSRRGVLNAAAGMLRAADLVTTPSDKTAIRVKELAPEARVRVSPNGADALPPGTQLAPTPGPRIIYIGRIAPEKGIPLLLDAFGWVREEIPDAELMIVGDWTASTALKKKLTAARRRGGVTLVGQIDRDALAPYYDSADVFAFPSLTDTQALVLHEAAHEGVPIVSVDAELRLVIDEGVNGMFARPTPESLARALVTMLRRLDDPWYRAAAHARSREMASWWTIKHQGEEMIGFYADLAARRDVAESMHALPPSAGDGSA